MARQLVAPASAAQRRTFMAAAGLVRAKAAVAAATSSSSPFVGQQVRGVKTIDFAGSKEKVWGECLVIISRCLMAGAWSMVLTRYRARGLAAREAPRVLQG